MRFFDLREASRAPFRASFRESKLLRILIYLGAFYAVLIGVLISGKSWFAMPGGEGTRKLFILAVAVLGIASIAIAFGLTIRPSNWLLRIIGKGILVNLAPFGKWGRGAMPAALFLEPGEIEWAGSHDEDRRCLCLRLRKGDWRELEDRIGEVGGPDPQVRLIHERLLLLRWGGSRSWVLPGIAEAAGELTAALEKAREPRPARKR